MRLGLFETFPITDGALLMTNLDFDADEVRIESERFFIGGQSLGGTLREFAGRAEIAISLGDLRIDRDGFLIGGDRLFAIALPEQQIAEIAISFGKAWLQGDGLPEGVDGFADAQQFAQNIAGAKIGPRRFGSRFDNRVADRKRFLMPLQAAQQIGGIGMRFDEMRIDPAGLAIGGERGFEVAPFLMDIAEI